jgi:NADH-quinone oxidoreductase subunit C
MARTTVVVPRELLRATAEYCRSQLEFDYLFRCHRPVDRFPVEPRFEVSYHLVSIPKRTEDSTENAGQRSRSGLWIRWCRCGRARAGWSARFLTLMGIRFNGTSGPAADFAARDWEGHPLRRDYPTEGFRDVPSTYIPAFKKQ